MTHGSATPSKETARRVLSGVLVAVLIVAGLHARGRGRRKRKYVLPQQVTQMRLGVVLGRPTTTSTSWAKTAGWSLPC